MKCDVVSANSKIHSGEISMLVASGVSGEIGITPRHAPLITSLKPGALRIIDCQGEESTYLIGGGILEVMPHLVTVLADTALHPQVKLLLQKAGQLFAQFRFVLFSQILRIHHSTDLFTKVVFTASLAAARRNASRA